MEKHTKTKTKQQTTANWKTDLSEPILASTLETAEDREEADRHMMEYGQGIVYNYDTWDGKTNEEIRKEVMDELEREEAKKNYLIRTPPQGLPNDGKIPGLNTVAFKEFVYTRIDVECMTYDKSGEKIVAWMVDETKCEYAVWFKKAAEELEVWGAPKKNWWKENVDSEYRKWKNAQKNKAEDKKVLSAGRVGKTAGVKQKKSSLAHDANEVSLQPDKDNSN